MPHTAIIDNNNTYHFKAIFDCANISIIVTDSNGNITAINPFALKELGYTANELIGKKIEQLMPKRFHDIHPHHHNQFMKEPKARIMGNGKDLFAIKKDGTEFPIEVSLGKYNAEGHQFTIAFLNDISIKYKKKQK